MPTAKALTQFQVSLLQFGSKYTAEIELAEKYNKKALVEVIQNRMWNRNGSHQVEVEFTPREKHFRLVLFGFNEIMDSYQILKDINFYIRRFPFARTKIPRSRYLGYHIANYLNEVYILQNRLENYAKRIQRAYRKSPRAEIIKEHCEILGKLIKDTLKSVESVRGIHVHEARYTDKDLGRVEAWESVSSLVSNDNNNKWAYKYFTDLNYKETRKQWSEKIKTINESLLVLFDRYFGVLNTIVFDDMGQMIFPFKTK